MTTIVRAVLFGIAGAIGLAVGSLRAASPWPSFWRKTGGSGAFSSLGIMVPLFVVLVSALVGLVGGGIYGCRR